MRSANHQADLVLFVCLTPHFISHTGKECRDFQHAGCSTCCSVCVLLRPRCPAENSFSWVDEWPLGLFPIPVVCQMLLVGRLQRRSTRSLWGVNHNRKETGALQLFELSWRMLGKGVPVLLLLNIVAASRYGSGTKSLKTKAVDRNTGMESG